MKTITSLIILIVLVSCNSSVNRIEIDKTYHSGLKKLNSGMPYTILYSKDKFKQAIENATLVKERGVSVFIANYGLQKRVLFMYYFGGRVAKENRLSNDALLLEG